MSTARVRSKPNSICTSADQDHHAETARCRAHLPADSPSAWPAESDAALRGGYDHQLSAGENAARDRADHARVEAVDRVDARQDAARHPVGYAADGAVQPGDPVLGGGNAKRQPREVVSHRFAQLARVPVG